MAKSTTAKLLRTLWVLIFFILLCCLSGCGNSETETGTNVTTTGLTITSFNGSPTSMAAGKNSILTATVTDSKGAPVKGKAVMFTIQTNNSGATITTLNGGITDGIGNALAIYTAGSNNPSTDNEDTVQASITGATAALFLTRMSSTSAASGHQISLSASSTSTVAGASGIITATVRDGLGNPASGQTVIFSVLPNNSGATITTIGLGITDAAGQALANYTAGSNNSENSVQDLVQASVTDATGAIYITRTGSTTSSTTAVPDTLQNFNANPSTMNAGQMSTITVDAYNNNSCSVGQTDSQNLTFTIPVNNSGATLINSSGASVTSVTIPIQIPCASSLTSSITYKAGANLPTTTLEDVVLVTLGNGSTRSTIVTRSSSSSTIPSGYSLTLTSDKSSLVAGASSVITATVKNGAGDVVSGQNVNFSVLINHSTAPDLAIVNGTTDATGQAVAVYTAGSGSPSLSVYDTISASLVSGEAGATIITRLPAAGTGNRLYLHIGDDSDPDFEDWTSTYTLLYNGTDCIVFVKVLADDDKTPVAGVAVDFTIYKGDGDLVTVNGTTDNKGIATAVFTGPDSATAGAAIVRATISGTTNGVDAIGIVFWPATTP